jgi:hypothetical protein
MANWDKLNKEYSSILDSLTDSDWDNWMKSRTAKKLMRRKEMTLKSKMQAEKIYFSNLFGKKILHNTIESGMITEASLIGGYSVAGENTYAMAA